MEKNGKAETAARLFSARKKILAEMRKKVVGQDDVIEEILLTFLCGGHALIEGVPGLAKTLIVSTLCRIMDLSFSRIQFTPDLMPSDILGYEIFQEGSSGGERKMEFVLGPVFANMVFADEINRTPPKTQSALLEAMQEGKVTVSGKTRDLPSPFMVLATQNPIELEGTYPLPEAQLDRFMAQINISYPAYEQEKDIVRKTTGTESEEPVKVLTAEEISEYRKVIREVPVPDSALDFAVRMVRSTRPADSLSFDFVRRSVVWGAGPRAAQSLILAAKANALLSGRFAVSSDDIVRVSFPILRHRIILNFRSKAEGTSADSVIRAVLDRLAG